MIACRSLIVLEPMIMSELIIVISVALGNVSNQYGYLDWLEWTNQWRCHVDDNVYINNSVLINNSA